MKPLAVDPLPLEFIVGGAVRALIEGFDRIEGFDGEGFEGFDKEPVDGFAKGFVEGRDAGRGVLDAVPPRLPGKFMPPP